MKTAFRNGVGFPEVSAILPSGSGAYVVHKALEASLPGYNCHMYNPALEYFPLALISMRRHGSTIVHAPPDHAALVTPRGAQLVITFHNYYLDPAFIASSSLLQKLHYRTDLRILTSKAVRRASAVTAVSNYTAQLVQEDLRFRGRVVVIPNGIDVSRFSVQPHEHRKIRVLYCGNLSVRKGAHLLTPIAEKLTKEIEFWIANGLRGNPFRTRPARNMRILGPVSYSDMPALYNEVDIVIVPSLREGFGLVAAEAMASGLPVVASKGSAMTELVVEGESGFLVGPEEVSAFAERLNNLASDRSLRERMGRFNRERIVKYFNVETMVERYARLFAELA